MSASSPDTNAPASTSQQIPQQEQQQQQVHTYHCLCSNLLFATTHRVPTLPRRAIPALDAAYILPCPRLPRRYQSGRPADEDPGSMSDSEDDEDEDEDGDSGDASGVTRRGRGYTLLLSLAVPPRQAPVLVRRSDGLEKRWVLRCGRCKLAVAYQLDWSQFVQGGDGAVGGGEGRNGRREDVLYVLPGALMRTEEMKAGKQFTEEEMGFGLRVA